MDADLRYLIRLCQRRNPRKGVPNRVAYDAVRRDSLAFKVRRDSYRLQSFVRYSGKRVREAKLKIRDRPVLRTPLKNIAALVGFKIKRNWNPRENSQKSKPAYVFPKDYAAPKNYLGSGSSEYLGSFDNFSFETKPVGYDSGLEEKAAEKDSVKKADEETAVAAPSAFEKAVQKEINESYKQAG